MTDSTSSEQFAISPWKAEFKDPVTESTYRKRIMIRSARELRVAVFVWALLLLLFCFNDYLILGCSEEFLRAFLSRAIVIVPLLVFAFVLGRRPQQAVAGHTVTVLLIYGFTCFFELYFLYPRVAIPYIIMVTMVILISLFVFIPNRLIFAAFAALYGIIGTTIAVALATPANNRDVAGLIVALFLPTIVGFMAAYRLHTTWRKEFTALHQTKLANEELRREIDQRSKLEEELRRQASTDPLTGLYNRRFYEQLLEREIKQAKRYGSSLALCVLDLDRFKDVNDSYGHASGDVALCRVADACRDELRESDIIGRLGGEEFILILPRTDAAGAVVVADRLRERIAATEVETENARFHVTVSIGVTELQPADTDITELIRRADEAMYLSKAEGRNKVRLC
ncbi:MAG TPA: diguanylate cyclase [Deltaproteobacteria bacterium]|nr:diguanylate cyclase [Deltaproteobacteria bacterium]